MEFIDYDETQFENGVLVQASYPGTQNWWYGMITEVKGKGWFEICTFCITDENHNIISDGNYEGKARKSADFDGELFMRDNNRWITWFIPNRIPVNVSVLLEEIVMADYTQ
jgi:hypothetical protein